MPKLFSGKELEGTNKGIDTLFVDGLVERQDITNELAKHQYQQVYFGAVYEGWKNIALPSPVDELTIAIIASNYPDIIVTTEALVYSKRLLRFPNSQLILTVVHPLLKPFPHLVSISIDIVHSNPELRKRVQIKLFTGGSVYMVPLAAFVRNEMEKYDQDILVGG